MKEVAHACPTQRPHGLQPTRLLCPWDSLVKNAAAVDAAAVAAAAKSLQSCLILCDRIDSSPPGSSVPGILQAKTLEWVAISFSSA